MFTNHKLKVLHPPVKPSDAMARTIALVMSRTSQPDERARTNPLPYLIVPILMVAFAWVMAHELFR